MRIPDAVARFADLAACMVVGLLMVAFTLGSINSPANVVLGALLVLLVPGYALTALLWSRETTLDIGDRVIFSVGLSVSLTVFSILLLSVTGAGIYPLTVSLALAYESLVFSILALGIRSVRQQGMPADLIRAARKTGDILGSDIAFWPIVAVLLLVAAVLVAMIITIPAPPLATQFYVSGPDGTTSTLPTALAVNESAIVVIGVYNGEGRSLASSVSVCLAASTGPCPVASAVFADWTSTLSLVPNETYVLNLSIDAGARVENPLRFAVTVPGAHLVSVALDGPGVHRDVRFPLTVTP